MALTRRDAASTLSLAAVLITSPQPTALMPRDAAVSSLSLAAVLMTQQLQGVQTLRDVAVSQQKMDVALTSLLPHQGQIWRDVHVTPTSMAAALMESVLQGVQVRRGALVKTGSMDAVQTEEPQHPELTLMVVAALQACLDAALTETLQLMEITLMDVRTRIYQFLLLMFVDLRRIEDLRETSLLDGVLIWSMVVVPDSGMEEQVETETTLRQKKNVMRSVLIQ